MTEWESVFSRLVLHFLPGAGVRGEVPAGIHDHLHEMAASDLSACPGESSWLISLLRSSISESSGRVPVFPSPYIYIAWEKQNVTGFAKEACMAGCMTGLSYGFEEWFSKCFFRFGFLFLVFELWNSFRHSGYRYADLAYLIAIFL